MVCHVTFIRHVDSTFESFRRQPEYRPHRRNRTPKNPLAQPVIPLPNRHHRRIVQRSMSSAKAAWHFRQTRVSRAFRAPQCAHFLVNRDGRLTTTAKAITPSITARNTLVVTNHPRSCCFARACSSFHKRNPADCTSPGTRLDYIRIVERVVLNCQQ